MWCSKCGKKMGDARCWCDDCHHEVVADLSARENAPVGCQSSTGEDNLMPGAHGHSVEDSRRRGHADPVPYDPSTNTAYEEAVHDMEESGCGDA